MRPPGRNWKSNNSNSAPKASLIFLSVTRPFHFVHTTCHISMTWPMMMQHSTVQKHLMQHLGSSRAEIAPPPTTTNAGAVVSAGTIEPFPSTHIHMQKASDVTLLSPRSSESCCHGNPGPMYFVTARRRRRRLLFTVHHRLR